MGGVEEVCVEGVFGDGVLGWGLGRVTGEDKQQKRRRLDE